MLFSRCPRIRIRYSGLPRGGRTSARTLAAPPAVAVVTCRLCSWQRPRHRTQQNATFQVVEESRISMASTTTSPGGRLRRPWSVTAVAVDRERGASVVLGRSSLQIPTLHRRRIDVP